MFSFGSRPIIFVFFVLFFFVFRNLSLCESAVIRRIPWVGFVCFWWSVWVRGVWCMLLISLFLWLLWAAPRVLFFVACFDLFVMSQNEFFLFLGFELSFVFFGEAN